MKKSIFCKMLVAMAFGVIPATSILQKIDFFILSKYLIHIKQKQCTRNRT